MRVCDSVVLSKNGEGSALFIIVHLGASWQNIS